MSDSVERGPGAKRVWLIGLMCVVVAVLCYAGVMAWRLGRLRATIREATTLSSDSLADVFDLADRATIQLEGVYRGARVPLWIAGQCGWVPRVGPLLAVSPEIAEHGMTLARSGNQAIQLIEPWAVDHSIPPELAALDVGGLVALAEEHQGALDGCASQARNAADALASISLDNAPDTLTILQVGARYGALGMEALALLPELAGPEPRTYLLLALNNHELRASGGFISAIGAVTVGPDGVELAPFADSYKVENWNAPHPDPPEALREHMFIDLWTTRDGNWWPDFPTSARAVADLYELNQGVAVDGVIAADLYAAQAMLETLTPLALPSGRVVKRGEVGQVFRESWSLDPTTLRTDGVVVTATHDYVAVEVGLQFPATEGWVWFDDVALQPLVGEPLVVTNPSFEDADSDGVPEGWQTLGFSVADGVADGVVSTKSVSFDHSLAMVGDGETPKRVWQTVDAAGVGGSAWRISAESAARGVPNPNKDYAMTVDFVAADGTRDRHRATFPAFTHDWATAGSNAILGEWWRHRKDVIGEAMAAVAIKALDDPMSVNWPLVGIRAEQMLAEKHVQVALFADDPSEWIAGYGWDGALDQTEPDYLLVVDSNVGFNKVTVSMEQSLDYSVVAYAPDGPVSELTLVYTNTSMITGGPCDKSTQYAPTYDQLTQGCYWDYVRVYVPAGAQLLEVHESQEPIAQQQEGEFTVFSTSLLVAPGESVALRFTYQQPPYAGEYGLNVVKQAGVQHLAAEVHVLDLPPGAEIVWMPPRSPDPTDGAASRPLMRSDTVVRIEL